MNDDVLLRFLRKGLINVGGDDDKLGHLRQAAVDLTGVLEKTPTKTSPYALVAFDPDVPTNDPSILEVQEALRKRWETYVNTFSETPVTVFRAILLDALIRACGKNDAVAAAFVASARNVLPFVEAGGEQEIWAEIVSEIERRVEVRSEMEWATPATIPVADLKFDLPAAVGISVVSKKVDRSSLRQKLQAAAGPTTYHPNRGDVDTEGNPYWPQSNPSEWNYEFGTRTAEVLGGCDQPGARKPIRRRDRPTRNNRTRGGGDLWALGHSPTGHQ